MVLRLCQLCLAAVQLEPVVEQLCAIFGGEVCHRDPAVARFGLHNALVPFGTGFIEVVAPLRAGTAAGRFLQRRGGDGGYMVILDSDDLAPWRAHVQALGVRIAFAYDHGDYQGVQLHPRDTGGALLEINHTQGGEALSGAYGPAGPDWQRAVHTGRVQDVRGAILQSTQPDKLARRWGEILQRPVERTGQDAWRLALDNAALRFVPAVDGRGEGLAGIELAAADANAICGTAAERGCLDPDGTVTVGGVRFFLEDEAASPKATAQSAAAMPPSNTQPRKEPSMSDPQIQTATAEGVLTLTLNRPEKLNAWNGTMESEVRAAIDSAAMDDAVRAIVITGAGRGFCAGADMSILEAGTKQGAIGAREQPAATPAAAAGGGIEANYRHRFSYLLRVPKPIFAAINGPVAGIGLCLTLFCDFRYMAAGQKLTTAFAARGLIAEHGSSWMLPRLVGLTNALDLLYSARVVLTEEAAAMGLVKALPMNGFLPAVQAIAGKLVHVSSPRSIGVMKRQVFDALLQDIDQAWQRADEEMRASFTSEDFREGVAHWVEKRAPRFTGR